MDDVPENTEFRSVYYRDGPRTDLPTVIEYDNSGPSITIETLKKGSYLFGVISDTSTFQMGIVLPRFGNHVITYFTKSKFNLIVMAPDGKIIDQIMPDHMFAFICNSDDNGNHSWTSYGRKFAGFEPVRMLPQIVDRKVSQTILL